MLTDNQKTFIRKNLSTMSVKKIARAIGVPASEVMREAQAARAEGPRPAQDASRRSGEPSLPLPRVLTSYWAGFALVFGLALLLRVVYLMDMSDSPFFKVPILDAMMYRDWAVKILEGDWLGRGYPVFYMGPLYPYFLAVLYAILGKSPMGVAIVQVVLSSLTAALLYHLGRSVFGRAAGLIAGIMAAVYNMFIYFSNQLLMETLVTLLNVALLIVLVSAARRPLRWKWAAAGVLLGLSGAARGNILLFGPLAVAAIVMTFGWRERSRWLMPAGILTVSFLATVSPITLHNLVIGGDAVLLTSNSGINFYVGNTLSSDGLYNKAPFYKGRPLGVSVNEQGIIFPEIAKKELGRETLKPSAVSAFWKGKALDEMSANTGKWLLLLGSKLKYYLNAYEVPNNQSYYFVRQYSNLLSMPLLTFGILFPFALLGMLASARRWRETIFLYAFVAAQLVGVVMFFVVDRYRLGVVPVLMIFAAFGLLWLCGEIAEGRKTEAGLAAVVVLIGFALAYRPVREIDFQANYFNLGNVQWTLGSKEEALRSYDKALALNDRWQIVYVKKGKLLAELGRRDDAITELQTGLRLANRANDPLAAREAESALAKLGVSPAPAAGGSQPTPK
jgi:4-amino-4-deoxy-L-arabinose transferase-like glycosyltransferase